MRKSKTKTLSKMTSKIGLDHPLLWSLVESLSKNNIFIKNDKYRNLSLQNRNQKINIIIMLELRDQKSALFYKPPFERLYRPSFLSSLKSHSARIIATKLFRLNPT